ncbi:MAG: ATP-dependent helicase [Verrucomicrobiae bacterium]|nr:ATP-dependent helicase [Verrucomicrobiae bacterium]
MARDYVLHSFRSVVDLHIDYANELNPQQLAAVTALPGPSLVIAGAGAGKTRTLTYRVAFLIEQGIPPKHILLLTFTNKAANEMMHRVAELLGSEIRDLWGGTFHAIGNRILHRHADRIGYRSDFTILDREDARDLISTCLGEAGIDVKATRFPKPESLAEIFSLAANTCSSIRDVLRQYYGQFEGLAPQLEVLLKGYTERKRLTGVMDFDDLLVLWLRLLRENPDVLEYYQHRFQFILVDEYQDTNKLQSDIIDLLAARHRNVMAVGDDSQSIYAWRGANYLNILRFPERYPEAKIYKIETNYRSTPEILALANAAIASNTRGYTKKLTPVRKSGPKPALVVCADASTQAAFVAQRVLELREEGVNLSKIAVLYRSHFHAMELQMELTRRNIPFTITSGTRFFEQAHIKDVTAYLRLVCNYFDELSFKRVVRMLPGVGPKSAHKLWTEYLAASSGPRLAESSPSNTSTQAEDHEASKAEFPDSGSELNANVPDNGRVAIADALEAITPAVPAKTRSSWQSLIAMFRKLQPSDRQLSVTAMIQTVLECGYQEFLQANYDNYRLRLEDIEQLSLYSDQFNSLGDFLAQLALLSSVESEDATSPAETEDRLRLSTVHQAKGLEFDVVFLIMLCDGMFPSARAVETVDGEEEERRLFYVAITRARNELYLTYPLIRTFASGGTDYMQRPSRFLKEIPPTLLDTWNIKVEGHGCLYWD